MITSEEIQIARDCVEIATRKGADAVRISLNKNVNDSVAMLNGEVDKVSHSADRSLYFYIYAEGRYGTFSTNRLVPDELETFIGNAVEMVKMLGEDRCRTLPDSDRTAKDAVTGLELGLYDNCYEQSDSDGILDSAERLSIYKQNDKGESYTLISEECEYTESYDDTFLIDSKGFEGRHIETTFSAFAEMTIEGADGNKYSGFWWENSPMKADLDIDGVSRKALERAISQIGPKSRKGGKYRMVVDSNVASRLVSPLLTALNASSIQQKMSFLDGKLEEKVFPDGMTLMDMARTPGRSGSRLFDTEGVATKDTPIIEKGVIRQYFVNTYMANKMRIAPTIEDISRPCLMPYHLSGEEKEVSLKDILQICGSGIYVTGFNGGNCNPVTGDFSYGVEGFAFSRGKITHPVKEMLITGNIIELWNTLVTVGTDARKCSRWQIPTVAFEGVSFSA